MKKTVLSLFIFLFFAKNVYARCAPSTLQEHLKEYDLIIKGKYLPEDNQHIFQIEDVYKGKINIGEKINIKISTIDADFSMESRKSYVVYIKIENGKYKTKHCSRMGPSDYGRVKGDIKYLESNRQ